MLVTAGPTREHVDPVRYLSNESSGRMGFAIAQAAAEAGHEVTLVAGPVSLATPPAVRRIDVVTAREMLAAVQAAFRHSDALFMAAAVCDWRPKRRLAGKWREKDKGRGTASLELVKNPDILAACGHDAGRGARGGSGVRGSARADQLVVGFALETSSGIPRARAKMKRKGADFIVLNDERALNSPRASALILGAGGSIRRLHHRTKLSIARELVALLRRPPIPDRAP